MSSIITSVASAVEPTQATSVGLGGDEGPPAAARALILDYQFEPAGWNGSTTADTSGNGYDATINGASQATAKLGSNGAFVNNPPNYLGVPTAAIPDTASNGAGSWCGWIYQAGIGISMQLASAGSSSTGEAFSIYGGNNKLFIDFVYEDNGTKITRLTSDVDVFTNGSYRFVGVTTDGTSWKIYSNGVEVAATLSGSGDPSKEGSWFTSVDTPDDFSIGRRGASSFIYSGATLFDVLNYYNFEMTPAEMLEMYNSGAGKVRLDEFV